jgi:anti-sigma B factor antagonist
MEGEVQPFYVRRRAGEGRIIVLEVGGECDASKLDELNEALHEVVEQQPREVVIDLACTTFIDSLTLGALTAAAKQVRARGGLVAVVRARAPEVRRAFEITGLDRYLLAGVN